VLRMVILAAGVAFLAGAVVLYVLDGPLIGVVYLGASGALMVAGILFARGRYRTGVDRSHDRWQSTGERFVDPTSGRLMEVRYDPETGERDYVEVDRGQEHSEPR
jgi:hypothetical protein